VPSGLIRHQTVSREKLEKARWMRSHMTAAEKLFWQAVRTNKLNGLHFRRQQVLHGFIADFYCEKLNLVVEIDGGVHEQQKDYDALRDEIINLHGIRVMRFTNAEVMGDIGTVLERIVTNLTPPFPSGKGQSLPPSPAGKGDEGG
jgi:very-short-patch-repair endonuclease